MWITHGDLFDTVVQHARWLANIGDNAFTFLIWLNVHFNKIRSILNAF